MFELVQQYSKDSKIHYWYYDKYLGIRPDVECHTGTECTCEGDSVVFAGGPGISFINEELLL
jgi:hypothetical protein